MIITAHFYGILADWVGIPSAVFDLSAGATVGAKMQDFGPRDQRHMPQQIWARQTDTLKKQLRVQGAAITYTNLNMPLGKGEEITFMLMIAGG